MAGIIEKTEKVYNSKRGILIFVQGLGQIQDLNEYLANYFGNNNYLEFFFSFSSKWWWTRKIIQNYWEKKKNNIGYKYW